MFTNTDGCTIWEKTVKDRAPFYIRHQTGAVYREITEEQSSGKDRSPACKALVVIPAANLGDYLPKKDDRILCGIYPEDQPPQNAMTVMSVKDFRYGSAAVQHVEVSAE